MELTVYSSNTIALPSNPIINVTPATPSPGRLAMSSSNLFRPRPNGVSQSLQMSAVNNGLGEKA